MSLYLITIHKINTTKNLDLAKIWLITYEHFIRSLFIIGLSRSRVHELYNYVDYFSSKKSEKMPTKEHSTNSIENRAIFSLGDPVLLGYLGNI